MSFVGRCKKRAAKFVAVIAVALCACMLTGCGAALSVTDYVENGRRVNVYELSIERAVVQKMEASAAVDPDGVRYTVPEYFRDLFDGFGYELVSSEYGASGYRASFKRAFSSEPDLYGTGTAPEFVYTHRDDPFVRTYTAVAPNPFNGVRAAYDAVTPAQSGTVIQQLKNGKVAWNEYGELEVLFPSVGDAFPYVKGIDPDGLLLEYVFVGSARMESSGSASKIDGDRAAYAFSRYFDRTEREIAFEYRRPIPYGWYLVAIAAGGATVAIFVIATRKKKQKPTLLDRFPYNPEQYRDYDSHLPTRLG